jgi:NADH:ubiquinone oxidoreductase subunit 6 (subunit J)
MSFFLLSCIFHSALLAISVSWTRSPFMALMFAVLLFVNSSVVLLMLGFEFLALVNMLVYVGALAVLFLFVIMLLEIPSSELRAYNRGYSALALFGILGITKTLFSNLGASFTGLSSYTSNVAGLTEANDSLDLFSHGGFGTIAGFIPTLESLTYVGHAFYVRYADLLILNSLILTIALFGALVLAHTR